MYTSALIYTCRLSPAGVKIGCVFYLQVCDWTVTNDAHLLVVLHALNIIITYSACVKEM